MADALSQAALDTIFMAARTHSHWRDTPVSDATLTELHALMKMGPTSANCSPARLVFVKSDAAKQKLKPHLVEGNRDKTMAAPVCVIIGYDLTFYEKMPQLFPHFPGAKEWFTGSQAQIEENAFRNGTLQGAYLIIAARALGLDCGPMSGFDAAGVDAAFFDGTPIKSNFLCNIGYGDAARLHPRAPRFAFDDVAQIV